MKPFKATLQHSVHANTPCVSCHVAPTFVGGIRWRAKEWVNILAVYLNMPPAPARQQLPSNANCTSCHSMQNLGTSSSGVRFSHAVHMKQYSSMKCPDCHNDVSHAKPGHAPTVSMNLCSMCHAAQIQKNQCSFCHTTPPPKEAHPVSYLDVHGRQALANPASCGTCHHDEASFCGSCHSSPPNNHFSGNWLDDHSAAAKADPTVCSGCHDYQTFCVKCHQVDHPADWVDTHGRTAAKGSAPCLVCHQQSYCDICHTKMRITT